MDESSKHYRDILGHPSIEIFFNIINTGEYTSEQAVCIFNILKYMHRLNKKGCAKSDAKKIVDYAKRLENSIEIFDEKL